jgi:hypothetical protein
MSPEFVNMYIDRLLKEIEESAKSRLLIDTQLKYTELMNSQLQAKVKELEVLLEKQNKKSKKTEESNSIDTF